MNQFVTDIFEKTGRDGMIIDTGKDRGPGASRVTGHHPRQKGKNSDNRGNGTIFRGVKFSSTDSRCSKNEFLRVKYSTHHLRGRFHHQDHHLRGR